MNNIRFLKTVIIILILLNIGTLTFLWMGRTKFAFNQSNRDSAGFLIRELNLTSGQQNQFGKLRQIHLEQLDILRENDRKLHDRFFDALFLPAPDTLTASKLADTLSIVRKEMEMLTFRHFLELQKLLNDNQKMRFRQVFRGALEHVMPPPPPLPPPPPPPLPSQN
ncbi:MAG: hypothetical protein WCP32_12005 [Bacteroidota bacterium]